MSGGQRSSLDVVDARQLAAACILMGRTLTTESGAAKRILHGSHRIFS